MEKSSSPRVSVTHMFLARAMKFWHLRMPVEKVLSLPLCSKLRGARVANFRRWIVHIHFCHHPSHAQRDGLATESPSLIPPVVVELQIQSFQETLQFLVHLGQQRMRECPRAIVD